MDKYAILVNDRPKFAPKDKDNISNYNLCPELMIADGYKLYVEGTTEEGKLYHETFEETEDKILQIFTEFTPEEYAEEERIQQEIERRRLDSLTLTPADVERALYYTRLAIDFDDLKALIAEQAPSIDLKGLAIEFRAKDFYRGATDKHGNRIIDMIGLLLGLDSADLDYLFEHKELSSEAIEKAYNHLHPQPEPEPEPEVEEEPEPEPEGGGEEELEPEEE